MFVSNVIFKNCNVKLPETRFFPQAWRPAIDQIRFERTLDTELSIETNSDAKICRSRRDFDWRRIGGISVKMKGQLVVGDIDLVGSEIDFSEIGLAGLAS
jgi:hypothetical protein